MDSPTTNQTAPDTELEQSFDLVARADKAESDIAKLRTDPDLRAVHFDDPDLSLDSDEGSLEG